MRKVYIAGPYMSHNENPSIWAMEIERNIRIAREAAVALADMGIGFFCPHNHTANFHNYSSAPESFYKELDIDFVRLCDAIALLPDWELSSGAKAELEEAMRLGLEIFDLSRGQLYMLKRWYFGEEDGDEQKAELISE